LLFYRKLDKMDRQKNRAFYFHTFRTAIDSLFASLFFYHTFAT
jgi:hypothetical protein